MAEKNRVDTGALFAGMIGKNEQEEKIPEKELNVPLKIKQEKTSDIEILEMPKKTGRKEDQTKKIQVSVYLTKAQDRELCLQGAIKEKETDKSALARVGIDIVLSLSNEEYAMVKKTASETNQTMGKVIKAALASFKGKEN